MDYFRVASSNDTTAPSLAGPGASVVPKEALIVDDTGSSISYSGGWELIQSSTMAISPRNACFFRNTIHRTTIPNAMANFTFAGTAVWYFSDIDYTHGFVQISVDGAAPEQVAGTYHQPHLSQRLIWYKTGLSAGQHVVTIAHGGQPNQYATVDFFMYLPSNATSSASTPNASKQTNENEPRPIRISVIIGVAIGGVIGLGAFLYGAFLVYQRQVQWKGLAARSAPGATAESELYESMPFIITPQSQATTTPTHRFRSKLLGLNSMPSDTSTSGMSEHSFSTSGPSTSRGFTDYNPHDPPPSYPYH